MKLQITNVAAGGAVVKPVEPGQHPVVKIAKGQRLALADKAAPGQAEGVVATRDGEALELKYADGTSVRVENFYTECVNGECEILVDGAAAEPVSLTAETAGGADVVYAYGSPEALHGMLGDAAEALLAEATSVAGGMLEFAPATAAVAAGAAPAGLSPWTVLGLGALGVAGVAAAASGGGGHDNDDTASTPSAPQPVTPPARLGAPVLALKHDAGGSASDGVSNDGRMVVKGVDPGNTWEYTTDGGTTWKAGTGDEFDLPEGDYKAGDVKARQIDAAGHKSPVSNTPSAISIDKTPPTSGFDAPAVALKNDAGGSASDGLSNDGTMKVTGVTPGNGWEYTTDGGTTWKAGSGDEFDLPEGDYKAGDVKVRQVDLAGNTSPAGDTPTAITIDKTPPTSGFDAPVVKLKHDAGGSASDGVSNDGRVSVSGVDPAQQWEYTTDGGQHWTRGSGDGFDLPEGQYKAGDVQARQIDPAGNTSPIGNTPTAITIDNTPPTSGFDAPAVALKNDKGSSASDGLSNDGTMKVTGVTPGNGWEYTTDGGTTWKTGTGDEFELPAGDYNAGAVKVRQVDLAGNTSPSGDAPSAILIDKTPPTSGFDAPAVALKNDAGGSASDGLSNDGTMKVTGVTPGNGWEYTTDGGTTWKTGSGDEFDLPEGDYQAGSVKVRQVDTAGNTSASGDSASAIMIYKTPPTSGFDAPGVALKNDAGGSASDGLSNDGTMKVTGVTSGNGWEYTTDGGANWTKGTGDEFTLPEGDYKAGDVKARQIDPAGNTSPAGDTPTAISIDKTPPTSGFDAPTVALKNDAGGSSSDGLSNDGAMKVTGVTSGNGWEYTTDGGITWKKGTGDEFDLPEGDYNAGAVKVRQVDPAGNTSPAGDSPAAITIDKTPPTSGFDAPGVALKNDAGGSASDGLSNDGTMKVTGVTSGNGWEYTTDGGTTWKTGTGDEFDLPEGDYKAGNVKVRQVDPAGNKSPAGDTPAAITIDKTPPTSGFDAPTVALKNDAGGSASDGLSNDGTMKVTGVTTGNGWEYTTDGGTTWTKGTGDEFDLPEGDYQAGNVKVRQIDPAGNKSPAGDTPTSISIDKTPPTSGFDAPAVALKNDGGGSASDGLSNDGTMKVTGVTPGNGWEYTTDGGTTWKTGSGDEFELPEGDYKASDVKVRQVDSAGNKSVSGDAPAAISIDKTPPTTGFDAPGVALKNDAGGSASDGLSNDGTMKVTGVTSGNGWEYTTDGGSSWTKGSGDEFMLPEGDYQAGNVKVRQIDPAGNKSPSGDAPTAISIDKTPPTSGFDAPTVALKNDAGGSASDGLSNDGTMKVTGVTSGNGWEYTTDGGTTWKTGAGDEFDLPEGDYQAGSVKVRQVDPAGNKSASGDSPAAITIDKTPPTTGFNAPGVALKNDAGGSASDGLSNDGTMKVTGVDPANGWEYTTDGGTTWKKGTGDEFDLPEGDYQAGSVKVRQVDPAGNKSASGDSPAAITIDKTPPTSGFDAPAVALKNDAGGSASDGLSNDGTMKVTGITTGNGWEYTTDGGSTWKKGSGDEFDLPEGDYKASDVKVRQVDPAGNTSASGDSPSAITIDKTPPTTGFNAPGVALKNDAGGSQNDGLSNDGTMKVTGVDPANGWEYTTDGGSSWTKGTGDEFTLPEGDYQAGNVKVRQIDPAGNKSPAGDTPTAISIDKTPPTSGFDAPSVALKNDAGSSASDGLSKDGTMKVSGVTPGNGWEYTTDGGTTWKAGSGDEFDLPEGDYQAGSVKVRQVDTAGNTSPAGDSPAAITIDKTPPTSGFDAPTVALRNDTGASATDGISRDGTMVVTGVGAGNTWEYSTDGGASWTQGSGDTFTLKEGSYAADAVQVRQSDVYGNGSAAGKPASAITIDQTPPPIEQTPARLRLVEDSGESDTDGITNKTYIAVEWQGSSNINWDFSTDGGATWKRAARADRHKNQFSVGNGVFQPGQIVVRGAPDEAGNYNTVSNTSTYDIDSSNSQPPVTFELKSGTAAGTEAGTFVSQGTFKLTSPVAPGNSWQYTTGKNIWYDGFGDEFTLDEGRYDLRFLRVRQVEPKRGAISDSSGLPAEFTNTTRTLIVDHSAPVAPTLALKNDNGPANNDGISSDGTMSVAGIEAGASWEYSTDGGASWQAGSGDSFVLALGSYAADAIRVRQTDAAGNVSAVARNAGALFIGVPAPVVALADDDKTPGDGVSTNGLVKVSGVSAGNTWEYTTDGRTWQAGVGDGFTLTDGTYVKGTVQVRQIDAAGVRSAEAEPATTLAISQFGLAMQLKADTGESGTDGVTADGRIVFSGKASGPWQYSLDSGQTWHRVSASQAEVRVRNGTYEVDQIQVRDRNNHTLSNKQRYEILGGLMDKTPVPVMVHDTGSSAGDHVTNDGTFKVSGGTAGLGLDYSLDGGVTWMRATGDTFVVPDGVYNDRSTHDTLAVRFADRRSGQLSPVIIYNQQFIVDTKAPDAPDLLVQGARNGVTHNGAVSVGSLEPGGTWEYSVDGGASWVAGSGTEFALAIGSHAAGQVGVRQIDRAGNVSQLTWNAAPITVVTGLSVQLRNDLGTPEDGVSRSGTMLVTGVGQGEQWQYSLDGGASWSSSFDASVKTFLLQGEHYDEGMVRVRKTDTAGATTDAQAIGSLDWQVLHWDSAGAQAFTLDASRTPGAAQANVLANGDTTGQALTLAHLNLSGYHDPASTQLHVAKAVNLSFTRDGQAVDTFTLADVVAGRIRVSYTQTGQDTAGTFAHASFTVTDRASGDVIDIQLGAQPGFHDGNGQWLARPDTALWGDPSADGWKAPSDSPAPGQGGADTLVGGSGRDLIFGDGSGGGLNMNNGFGGAPGSGDDVIHGGQGDDILFGDGFGNDGRHRPLLNNGGFGGGGGGGGVTIVKTGGAGGVGAGAGGDRGGAGHGTTLGNADTAPGTAGESGFGVGVGSGRPQEAVTAEVDGAGQNNPGFVFDNTGNVTDAITQVETAFVDGAKGGSDLFAQAQGAGNDHIYGGAGNDLIMGMVGNDLIVGGTGNDIMYGRGASFAKPAMEDADTFLWQRGDAGKQGTALDVIRDFGGDGIADHLDIQGLLEGYVAGHDLKDWVSVQTGVTAPAGARGSDVGATGTLITIDVDGAGAGTTVQQIFLTGVDLDTNVNNLVNTGVLIV
ncbi:hypothetical protein [Bordetella genomosp. 1]|uniref:Uncharacterized protein n=1 Tax=Bordetella genomosp. 1 TaxID=1395607 RepID=A0ABX4F0U6_9BORD|nr:hypothetical protein [Bordetella genomosp. 1]OZI65626.1 hypothetical protein CAL27_11410 [Bordetella genomosp. 1]